MTKIMIVNDGDKEPYEAAKLPEDMLSPEGIKAWGLDQMYNGQGNKLSIDEAAVIMRKRLAHALGK